MKTGRVREEKEVANEKGKQEQWRKQERSEERGNGEMEERRESFGCRSAYQA